MTILAVAALVFGLLASLVFAAAPFVAGSVILAIAIVGLGLLAGFAFADIVLRVVVASAALQAGYLIGLMRNLRGHAATRATLSEERSAAKLRRDKSTMDGSL